MFRKLIENAANIGTYSSLSLLLTYLLYPKNGSKKAKVVWWIVFGLFLAITAGAFVGIVLVNII